MNNVRAADGSNINYALDRRVHLQHRQPAAGGGIEMAGLAIAFPVSIGIALVVGVILSYALQPKGDALMLAVGVALAILAVILDGKAYGSLPSRGSSVSRKSIVVCLISGVLMGTFAPFVTRALTAGHPLTSYSIAVFFTLGALLCCFVVNVYFMKNPLVGAPVDFSGYFRAVRTMSSVCSVASCGAPARYSTSPRRVWSAWPSPTRSARPHRWWRRSGASWCGRSSAGRVAARSCIWPACSSATYWRCSLLQKAYTAG